MTVLFAFIAALAVQPVDDGPIRTGGTAAESADSVRVREAIAYANPMPPGAPTDDYALTAWCDALVSGHVRLGETLTDPSDLDLEIMRLGRLEAADFRAGLAAARDRQSPRPPPPSGPPCGTPPSLARRKPPAARCSVCSSACRAAASTPRAACATTSPPRRPRRKRWVWSRARPSRPRFLNRQSPSGQGFALRRGPFSPSPFTGPYDGARRSREREGRFQTIQTIQTLFFGAR